MSTSTGPTEGPTDDAWETAGEAYRELYRTLLRVAFVITGSGPAAEDVVHDVFVSAGHRIGALEHPESYLRVAVVNRCRSLHRRATRAPEPPVPDHASLDVELIELQDALASLSDRQRAAIVLRYLCDLPDEEIAAALKCRRSTVRSLVRRGLAELREVIR